MSRELVKWQAGKLAKPSPVDENRRVLTTAMALLKPSPAAPARGNVVGSRVLVAAEPGAVVDLPRMCAMHDKPSAARYVMGADGRYHYAQTIKVTEALFLAQYADNTQRVLFPGGDIADETCPWCGASGFGAVLCTGCNFEICYGRTAGRFFRCRAGCGHAGNMAQLPRTHEGVTPKETRGGGGRV